MKEVEEEYLYIKEVSKAVTGSTEEEYLKSQEPLWEVTNPPGSHQEAQGKKSKLGAYGERVSVFEKSAKSSHWKRGERVSEKPGTPPGSHQPHPTATIFT